MPIITRLATYITANSLNVKYIPCDYVLLIIKDNHKNDILLRIFIKHRSQ